MFLKTKYSIYHHCSEDIMNSLTFVTITLEVVAISVLLHNGLYILRGTRAKYNSGKYLLPFCCFFIFQLAMDIMTEAGAEGKTPTSFFIYKAGLSASFLFFYITCTCISYFFAFYTANKKKTEEKLNFSSFDTLFAAVSFALAIAGVVLIILNQTKGFIYAFSPDNAFIKGPLYYLTILIPALNFIINTLYLLSNRKCLSVNEKLFFHIFTILPVAAAVFRYFSFNIGVISLVYTLVFTMVFENTFSMKIALWANNPKGKDVFYNRGQRNGPVNAILHTYDLVFHSVIECNLDDNTATRLVLSGTDIKRVELKSKWDECIEDIIKNEIHPEDREIYYKTLHPSNLNKKKSGDYVKYTYRSKRSGEYSWWTTAAYIVQNDEGGNSAIYLTREADRDTDDKLKARNLSDYDGLTDLYNRKKLKQMIAGEYLNLKSCGVIFFDLNYLKKTNDTFGHDAGDTIICRAADSIRSITNNRIHAYRIGGDEFIVVVCNCAEGELSMLICLWKARLDQLNSSGGIECSVSVGCAWAEGNISVEKLIKQADAEMYKHKTAIKAARD